jgi:hypothetical protein
MVVLYKFALYLLFSSCQTILKLFLEAARRKLPMKREREIQLNRSVY